MQFTSKFLHVISSHIKSQTYALELYQSPVLDCCLLGITYGRVV